MWFWTKPSEQSSTFCHSFSPENKTKQNQPTNRIKQILCIFHMWNYFSKPLLLNHSNNYLRKFLIISGKDVSPGGMTPKKTTVQAKKLKTDSSDENCTHLIDQKSLWKKKKICVPKTSCDENVTI